MNRPPRARASTRKRHIAIHEAAHAVVAEALGIRVWHVSVDRGCLTYPVPVPASRRWLTGNAVVAYAGEIAERRVAPHLVLANGQDRHNARCFLARTYPRNEIKERLQRSKTRAERMVDGDWLAIERVAAHLVRAGTLDGMAVRACIDGMTRPPAVRAPGRRR